MEPGIGPMLFGLHDNWRQKGYDIHSGDIIDNHTSRRLETTYLLYN